MRAARPQELPTESLRIPRPWTVDGPDAVGPKDEVITDPKAIAAFFG